ncbi:MAG: transcription-repair coupling factor [Candidatus Cloacimonetes bacterium]|nr:transcription-repair coupling factor [Candidatus Cloacimonadota bacterium]MCF7814964.1 transcription-repair coupling factor [Candidatus Cloacimonadota bacterium]MCF7868425.1 transcription-repair coupling factor [Candidatus Cloacimonadota bacterium]MCF7883898.1 transcription-repair coupling factor [Candidatus Cloacimonadota bacterium]
MFYNKINKLIDESKFLREFDELSQNSGLLVHNLNRSAKSLLLARAINKTGKNVIFVTADDKMAEEYLEDLDLMLGRDAAYFLPDYEVLPYEQRSPHYLIRAQRIETLTAAVSAEPAVFTVSIRSLLRKITASDIFGKNIITLRKNEDFDPDVLVSDLVGMGYENQFQVSKVGEIARRGGIIDVFSPNSHKPVRIEFFGDEVESIRVFSVSSQRSTGEELNKITLIPSREFSLHDLDTSEEMWQRIHKDGFYEGIELDASLLLSKTETFLQYFDVGNCLVFWDEFQFFQSYFQEILEETTELYQKIRAKYKNRKIPQPEDIFESEKFVNQIFKAYKNIFLNGSFQEFPQISNKLEAPITAQTNMHGSLEILEQEISARLEQDYHVFLQSDNKSQSKRMLDLLPQFENKMEFTIGVLQNGFNLTDARLAVFTDHEIFSRYKRKRRQAHFSKEEALVDYESLKPGDYVVHIDHGIGIYSGLKKLTVGGNTIECLTLNYAENDVVYVPTFQLSLVSKFVSEEGIAPSIHKLGSKKWENTKNRAKKQIELVAEDLIQLYAERNLRRGIAFDKDNNWQTEMEESFIYEDTPDQAIATKEIKGDMEDETPMERLLCGDVGFGKTEVAIRAAFKAVMSGWQVAVLVPTTLLAEQHYLVFKERLAQYPIRIAMFSRFRTAAKIRKDVARLARGEIDIAIGTHRLLSKDIKYKKLGLLVIDEEHRFGVRHKDKLRQMKSNVDTLYMSATPIPRTMYMALSKLKELSLIRTSPKARLPIRTVIVPWDENVIKDAINREVDRGGQVFFVHNRVQTIESVATELRKLLPNVSFGIGHGQLPEKQLEAVTLDFAHHKFDVLIATTIIESGIDIPNANTIIVNRADMFGLAQLYQIRGRVGRSNRRAYAYLIIPPKMHDDARKRLETLIEYESLGSGYQIAMRDMELRGAGTLLGTKQSGIINSIGFNYYNRLLTKAIENIQAEKPKEEWLEEEPQNIERLRIESDHYFPESYIESEKERLEVYRKLLEFETLEEFDEIENELLDRFGKIPDQAVSALKYFRLRLLIEKTGLEALKMKNNSIIVEFNTSKMPARRLLTKFIDKFKHPVKIDAVKGFKIVFEIDDAIEDQRLLLIDESLRMAEFLYENLN